MEKENQRENWLTKIHLKVTIKTIDGCVKLLVIKQHTLDQAQSKV